MKFIAFGQNSGSCLTSLIMPSCQLNFACLYYYLVIIALYLSAVHRDRKVCFYSLAALHLKSLNDDTK